MASSYFSKLQVPGNVDEEEMWEISPFSKFASSDRPLPDLDHPIYKPGYKEFVYEKSYEYLYTALFKGKHPKLFSQTRYWQLYNSVHLNCSQIFPQSPFNVYLSHIARVRPVESLQKLHSYIKSMNDIAADILGLPAEDNSEIIFHKLTKTAGSALFSLHSQMNHSCDPNVKSFTDKTTAARLDAQALRPIRKGDEICIDYVGVGKHDVAERKRQIREKYSFECRCDKCIAES